MKTHKIMLEIDDDAFKKLGDHLSFKGAMLNIGYTETSISDALANLIVTGIERGEKTLHVTSKKPKNKKVAKA